MDENMVFTKSDCLNCKLLHLERTKNLRLICIGKSYLGKNIYAVQLGYGERNMIVSACHHANEYITSSILMKFIDDFFENKFPLLSSSGYLENNSIYLIPLVNTDGMDLVCGNLYNEKAFKFAKDISNSFPKIPFPSGYKANLQGIDLNLQYPATWEIAKEIKYAQGFKNPAPRDFVGYYPLQAVEAQITYDFCKKISPQRLMCLHSQGEEIYYTYNEKSPKGAYELGKKMEEVSSYKLTKTPSCSDNGGFKDWFIKEFDRPAFTIEMGLGENPLPHEDFAKIYKKMEKLLCIFLEEN